MEFASPDHRHFAVGCADQNVVLWDMGMQRHVQNFDQHTDQVWNISFDKNDSTGMSIACSTIELLNMFPAHH